MNKLISQNKAYQLFFSVIIIYLLSGCSNDNRGIVNVEQKNDSADVTGDSIYRIGDFLFEGPKNMKFEFVKRGESPEIKTTGDTLYSDDTLVILGDWKDINSAGVFRKFKFRSDFKDFPADTDYYGKLVKPDFRTDPDARYFRTRIKEGCENLGINFAGFYTIIEWGCGSACQMMAVVNRKNGRILFSEIPFDTLDGHCGLDYRKDSRMIIINSEALSDHEGYKMIYWRTPEVYEIANGSFKKIE
jgi:hypothetical protein